MLVFRKTTKRGVRKYRNYTNKKGVRRQRHTRSVRRQRNVFNPKMKPVTLPTKSVNNISQSDEKNIWVAFNESIINDGFDEKVNKFKKKIGNVDGKIVYGKFWMAGCHYCVAVKGTWDLVVGSLQNHSNYVNVDILSDNIEEGKKALKEKTRLRQDIKSDGYPQFYKIINGNIYYYEGERNVVSMKNWLLSTSFSI